MRNIGIIGAGQGGLQLGFGLLAAGYDVTLYSDMTPEQLYESGARPVTIQFAPSHRHEDALDLRFWKDQRHSHIDELFMTVFDPAGNQMLRVNADFEEPAQTMDLRMKFSRWLQEFPARGGKVVTKRCDMDALEHIAASHDLLVVAAGRGVFSDIFAVDESKMEFEEPQRQVAMFYTRGANMHAQLDSDRAERRITRYSVVAGVGEVIMAPFLSKSGEEHHYVQFEGVPGQGMDMFDPRGDVTEQYAKGLRWLEEHHPAIYELVADSSLTPEAEWVCGRILPTVREPVGRLPSGAIVMGLGDAVIVNDPILAQGLNGASKWAALQCSQIIARGDQDFSEAWMQECFEEYWARAQYNLKLSATGLKGPGPVQQKIMGLASQDKTFANRFANCIGQAEMLHPWYWDDAAADQMIDTHRAGLREAS